MNTLKQQAKITEAVLRYVPDCGGAASRLPPSRDVQESKAGLAVGKLRSNTSKPVAELAKEIVRKWKHEVEREKAAGGGSKAAAKPPGASARTV